MSGGNQEEFNSRTKNTTKNTFQAPSSHKPGTALAESQRGGRGSREEMGCGVSINKQPGTFEDVADSGRGQDNRAWAKTGSGNNSSSESEDNDMDNGNIDAQGEASRHGQHRGDHGDGASAMENGETPTSHADLPKEISSKLKELEAKKVVYYREEEYLAMKDEYRKYIEELQTQVFHLKGYESKYEQEHDKVNHLQKRAEDLAKNITKLEGKLNASEKGYKEEKERADELDKQVKDFTDRLSAEMSDKMSRDESSLENVSIKNRPMNVADEYGLFCSGHWLNAKQFMDDEFPKAKYETMKLETLTEILMTCHNKSSEMEKTIVSGMKQRLLDPFTDAQIGRQKKTPRISRKAVDSEEDSELASQRSKVKTPRSDGKKNEFREKRLEKVTGTTLTAISDHLRMTADDIDLSHLVKMIIQHMKTMFAEDETILELLEIEQILDYIRGCTAMTWKMVIQRPPMMLNIEGIKGRFNMNTQDLGYGSADPKAKDVVVVCYANPALYHDKKLMQKGKVLLRPQKLK